MFSTPLRDQSHSLNHIFVLCISFRLMSLKFYCLVIHISHKTLEIGCTWSKGSGERLQGHHGPLVSFSHNVFKDFWRTIGIRCYRSLRITYLACYVFGKSRANLPPIKFNFSVSNAAVKI